VVTIFLAGSRDQPPFDDLGLDRPGSLLTFGRGL
jgi:hypothetical protein